MHTPTQIANQLHELYYGGNYTGVNFEAVLQDVTFKQAVTKVKDFNTIHTLVFHTQYYMNAVSSVLSGNTLDANDSLSFIHPKIHTQEEWQILVSEMFTAVNLFYEQLKNLNETTLFKPFEKDAYGTYFRNISGVIEHSHYHLGQIVFLKKMISKK